jgi:hypothetical protein
MQEAENLPTGVTGSPGDGFSLIIGFHCGILFLPERLT